MMLKKVWEHAYDIDIHAWLQALLDNPDIASQVSMCVHMCVVHTQAYHTHTHHTLHTYKMHTHTHTIHTRNAHTHHIYMPRCTPEFFMCCAPKHYRFSRVSRQVMERCVTSVTVHYSRRMVYSGSTRMAWKSSSTMTMWKFAIHWNQRPKCKN